MRKILLTGPAGSGKTFRILGEFEQSLRQKSDPLSADFVFLVPSVEHTERIITLLVQRGIPGFFHHRVTTLSRLISQLFGVWDENVATNVTRYLILRDLFQEKTWPYFSEVQHAPGFLNAMLGFLMELKESLVTPEIFRSRMNDLKRLEPDLASKYEALASIYEHYQQVLAQKGLMDPQDILHLYRFGQKPRPDFRFKKIWLDGFFDFSPLQLGYLRELCRLTDEITVTLTAESRPERESLFSPVHQTREALLAMGFEHHELPPRLPKTTEGPNGNPLVFIERNLFAACLKQPSPDPCPWICVYEAIGMEGEIEMIARQIEMLRRQHGYRFSDFAILLRQIGDYESVIRSVFRKYDLPVEIHEREKLGFAPFIQVVVSLLRIFREGWRRHDLMAFLKSTYVRRLGTRANSYEAVNHLENLSLRKGVFQGREAWMALDAAGLLTALAELEERFAQANTALQFGRLLLNAVVSEFGMVDRVDSFEEYVRRDAVSYGHLRNILEEIERSVVASHFLSFENWTDRFFRLAELDLYSLHERDKNCVQVYDVSLGRQKEYAVVFVAGLLEKKFPVLIKEDPILSDWERRLFNARGGEILDGAQLRERLPRQALERYLFYLAVTRARERLVLTYPRLDLEGKESLPSFYVQEIRGLFDQPLPEKKQRLSHPYPCPEEALNERELEMALVGRLWSPGEPLTSDEEKLSLLLFNRLLRRSEMRQKIRRAFYEVTDTLTDPLIRKTGVFNVERMSPTRLEEYATCAYKFFASQILQLNDPEEEVNFKLKGQILHEVVELFFGERLAGKLPPYPDRDRLRAYVEERLNEALAKYPLVEEKRYQAELDYEEMREMLLRFLECELERLRDMTLAPRYFELAFGRPDEGSLPALEIQVEGGTLRLSGRIDRIDTDPQGQYALVIDYKRSSQFRKNDLMAGTALQLPLYLLAVETYLGLRPIGAQLYSFKDTRPSGFYHEGQARGLLPIPPRSLQCREREFRQILERSLDWVRVFVRNIREMKINVRPRKDQVCGQFCPFASVCRIEKWKIPLILEEVRRESPQAYHKKAAVS